MKYKKWWMPAVFMVISAVVLLCSLLVLPNLAPDDAGEAVGGIVYGFAGVGLWFILPLPIMSYVYARKTLDGEKGRFWLTLYNSLLLVLPYFMIYIWDLGNMVALCPVIFLWCEMWALAGLAGKKNKKAAVWYVPVFLSVAILMMNLWLQIFASEAPDLTRIAVIVLSCAVCPLAIVFYTRICVLGRKSKAFYTVYSSLLIFAAIFGYYIVSIVKKTIVINDPVWDIVKFVLAAVGTFILYELAALLGAGVKIKLPKRKKKPKKVEKAPETAEKTEE